MIINSAWMYECEGFASSIADDMRKDSTMKNRTRREQLTDRFDDLYVGDLPEIYTMPLDDLESMIDTLEEYQQQGRLNLETDEGVANLKAVVDTCLGGD